MQNAKISYFYKKKFADFSMGQLHTHSIHNVEIMYVRSGRCRVITADQTITLNSGSYIILAKKCAHRLEAQSANIMNIEFYLHHIGNISLDDIAQAYPVFSQIFSREVYVYRDNGGVCSALSELIDELQSHGTGLCSELLFKRFLIELCRNHNRSSIGGVSYIGKTKDYIKEHLSEKITIDDIAQHIGLNRSYLQTLFKQHTGKTVIDYINALRIEKACFIIRNTNLPVIDVAIDCGFASRQHFLYTFKKHTGKTVREYRSI